MKRPWQKEMDLSLRLTGAVLFVFWLHTLVHIFGIQYVLTGPYSLEQTKPSFLGLRSVEVLVIASSLLLIWALCHLPLLRHRRWKVQHSLSAAILVLCTIGTLTYSIVLQCIDGRFRDLAADWLTYYEAELVQNPQDHVVKSVHERLEGLLEE